MHKFTIHYFLINQQKQALEELVEMSRNDYYTTGSLLDYPFHQNYYKIIGNDLQWY